MTQANYRTAGIGLALCLAAGTAGADVKLGVALPLSGGLAGLGEQMRKVADHAAAEINAAGGLLGEELTLLYADSACDAGSAVRAGRALLQDPEMVAIVGPVCSGATMRMARSVTIPAGVVTISMASASPLITGLEDGDTVFRTALSDGFKGQVLAQRVYDMGITSVGVTSAPDAYNTGVSQVFESAFKALGGEITVSQTHEEDRESYANQASSIVRRSPHVAIFAYSAQTGATFLNDLIATGELAAVFGADGMLFDETAASLSEAQIDQVLFVGAARPLEGQEPGHWDSVVSDRDLDTSQPYLPHTYDAVMLAALAVQAAGQADRALIKDGLRQISGPDGSVIGPGDIVQGLELLKAGETVNYDGASGPTQFDEFGDVAAPFTLGTVEAGGWALIEAE